MALSGLKRHGTLTAGLWPFLTWGTAIMDRHLSVLRKGNELVRAFRTVLRGRHWQVTVRALHRDYPFFQKATGNTAPGMRVYGLTRVHLKLGHPREHIINIYLDTPLLLLPTQLIATFIHELAHASHRVMLAARTKEWYEKHGGTGVLMFTREEEELMAEMATDDFRGAVGVEAHHQGMDPVVMIYDKYCDTMSKSEVVHEAVVRAAKFYSAANPCDPLVRRGIARERQKFRDEQLRRQMQQQDDDADGPY